MIGLVLIGTVTWEHITCVNKDCIELAEMAADAADLSMLMSTDDKMTIKQLQTKFR